MRLSMESLYVFVTASDLGSFSATGRHLKKAQSAISSAIANLEIDLGVVLFDRSGSQLKLTSEGQILLREAKDIIQRNNLLVSTANKLSLGVESHLSIAIDHAIPFNKLIPALSAVSDKFSDLDLKLHHTCGSEVSSLLNDYQVDFAIAPFHVGSENTYNIKKLFELSLACIVHCDHPLAKKKLPLTTQTLVQHRQLMLTDFSDLTGQKDKGTVSHHLWRMRDIDSLTQAVNAKLGWTISSLEFVKKQIDAGTFKVLTTESWGNDLKIPIVALHHFSDNLGPAANLFISKLNTG
ncbi:LysR family transcriptional regulator [Alteromonas sp. M12]|uniref:LysR family transcriptional regulator n=1 Tax=Alteromonas sp. M12 TaxID=3135644 RepID=UPI00319EA655